MRYSFYETNLERINPEFIGIASRYSQRKKQRLAVQSTKKELESDLKYATNLDSSLDRQINSRTIELEQLRQARDRH